MEGHNDDPLVTSMAEAFENLFSLSSLCCIYRVPKRLRLVSEKAYTPQKVSIGPLHHGKESLKPMEEYKKRYLHDFLKDRTTLSLKDCINIIREREKTLRGCYAETIEFSPDEFVRIILVDAIFIIEVLFRFRFRDELGDYLTDKNDRIFNKPCMLQDVWPDMRMLENQLPFFILEDLFNPHTIKFPTGIIERPSIMDLSHYFFKDRMNLEVTDDTLQRIGSSQVKVEHFVDFCRRLYPLPSLPLSSFEPKKELMTLTTPSMTELDRAGASFKAGSSKDIFGIKFSKGILEIPKITISDQTEVTITNLLVFEHSQCKDNEKYINDYFVVLKGLVKTPEDVDLLVKYKIFDNKLHDNIKGCSLIKNLADGIVDSKYHFYFEPLCEELNKYCTMPWRKWKGSLIKHFFNTPWATKEIIAAIIFLLLTAIQTGCSLYSIFT